MNKNDCLKAILLLSMRGFAYPIVKKDGHKYSLSMDKGGMRRFFASSEDVDDVIRDSFASVGEYEAWSKKKEIWD